MATSSILGGTRPRINPKGSDEETLGPSDSTDSGSDAAGTGKDRASAEAGIEEPTDSDILPDRVGVFPDAARDASTVVDDPEAADPELAGDLGAYREDNENA